MKSAQKMRLLNYLLYVVDDSYTKLLTIDILDISIRSFKRSMQINIKNSLTVIIWLIHSNVCLDPDDKKNLAFINQSQDGFA